MTSVSPSPFTSARVTGYLLVVSRVLRGLWSFPRVASENAVRSSLKVPTVIVCPSPRPDSAATTSSRPSPLRSPATNELIPLCLKENDLAAATVAPSP